MASFKVRVEALSSPSVITTSTFLGRVADRDILPDVLAVPGKRGHQVVTASDRLRPAGKVVVGFINCILGKGVEVVLAVLEATPAFPHNFEKGIKCFEGCVLGVGYDALPETCDFVNRRSLCSDAPSTDTTASR